MRYDLRYIEFRNEFYYIPGLLKMAVKAIAAILVMAAPLAIVVAAYFRFA